MRRLALITLVFGSLWAVGVAACGGDDEPTNGPPPATTSSSGSGGEAAGGSSTTGTGGDGGMGTGGTGTGGTGTGGMGTGGGMIGVGGGQGACLSCSAFFDACDQQGTCPPKSEVCQASFMILSAVVGCLCNSCIGECEATCTGVGNDMATCNACIQSTSTSSCQAPWATCQSDT